MYQIAVYRNDELIANLPTGHGRETIPVWFTKTLPHEVKQEIVRFIRCTTAMTAMVYENVKYTWEWKNGLVPE